MKCFPAFPYRLGIGLGAAVVVGTVTAARGEVVVAQWVNGTNYSYWADNMADFDQRRSGLANNGNMYCVPTACMNLAAYFATHGDPSMAPGLANWQSQANYDLGTGMLATMGLLMGTDPQDGTNGSGGLWGLTTWVNLSNKPYIVFRYSRDSDWAPKLNNAAHHAIQGAFVAPCVGWYDVSAYPLIDRDGGHCMTLVSASRSGNQMYIGLSDPATGGGDLNTQSTFMIDNYTVQNEVVMPFLLSFYPMSRIVGLGSGNTQAYMDSIYVIYPGFVLSGFEQPNEFTWNFAHIPWGSPDHSSLFTGPAGSLIVDLQMHADASAIFAIVQGMGGALGLWSIDPVTHEWAQLDIDVPDARGLHVSRMRDVYILDGDDVVCVAVDPDVPVETIRITPPFPPTAITSNDKTDSILVLSEGGLLKLPYELEGDVQELAIPNGVPTDLTEGGAMCYDAYRDAYWIVSPEQDKLFFLQEDGAGGLILNTYGHETLVAPQAVDVDNDGIVYVSTLGKIMEYEITPEGSMTPVANPFYVDVPAGRFLQVARSRTNHDPELHEGPEWRHRLPDVFDGTPTPLCTADLNNDLVVDTLDLLELLAAWGPCPNDAFCDADLDISGDVGVVDLIALLAAWGDC